MATATTTTRTTSAVPWQSAASSAAAHADFLFADLLRAYDDCRRNKRNTGSAIAFELSYEKELIKLRDELQAGTYRPGRSICFVITKPKPREVWAAQFRDRIVQWLLYNHIATDFHRTFIADSCACIPERGTLYGAKRLEHHIRSITQNWSRPCYYLKCDVANFFVSIDKEILWQLLAARIAEPWWQQLAHLTLFHDPRQDYEYHGDPALLERVPPHKRLTNWPSSKGLPIGNLLSQFGANVYLNELDQFIKHRLRCRHYVRYVDDFVLVHEDPQQLRAWLAEIEAFLPSHLSIELNPKKTILQPVSRGVDFVGHVIKPWRRTTRRRTVKQAIHQIQTVNRSELHEVINSYYGLLRQASHSHTDRVRLTKSVFRRGKAVNSSLTKTYRVNMNSPRNQEVN